MESLSDCEESGTESADAFAVSNLRRAATPDFGLKIGQLVNIAGQGAKRQAANDLAAGIWPLYRDGRQQRPGRGPSRSPVV
jgi:hypothetical protein